MPEEVKPVKKDDVPAAPAQEATSPTATTPAAKKKSSTLKIVLIVVGVLVGLGIIGTILMVVFFSALFKNAAENVSNNSDGTVTLQSDDGNTKTTVGENVELAQGFPSDVPIFEPSTLLASSKTDETDFSAVARTEKSVSDVSSYYKTTMAAQGWTPQLDSASTDGTFMTYQKGDRTSSVVVTTNNDEGSNEKTGFVVTVTTQKQQ